MANNLEEFKLKFKTKELLIWESQFWIWSLRPVQATLGSSILSLKRSCPVFSELTQAEFSDLNNAVKVIEHAVKKAFHYDIMNYLMLMMVDKQVHFHVIPRYQGKQHFVKLDWIDSGWPGVPNLSGQVLEVEKLSEILCKLKEHLPD